AADCAVARRGMDGWRGRQIRVLRSGGTENGRAAAAADTSLFCRREPPRGSGRGTARRSVDGIHARAARQSAWTSGASPRTDALARDIAQRTPDPTRATPERAAKSAPGARAGTDLRADALARNGGCGPKSRRNGATPGSRASSAGRRWRRTEGWRAIGGARTTAKSRDRPQRALG